MIFVVNSHTVPGCYDYNIGEFSHNDIPIDQNAINEKMARFVNDCNSKEDLVKSTSSFPSCYWNGGVFHYSGYCTMNRNLVRRVAGLGTNVKLYTSVESIDIPLEEAKWYSQHCHVAIPAKSPAIWSRVSSGPSPGKVIHYTMSEMEDHVNDKFLDTLSHDDEIWVPTEWNKDIFESSGVKTPIRVMPLGVDSSVYRPATSSERVRYTSGRRGFMFLAVSSWNWRKGWDVLLKAYFRAFTADDDVSLMILTRGGEGKGDVSKELPSMVRRLSLGKTMPHVAFSSSKIDDSMMHCVYSSADCFSLFPRGEGWCLPYCEAAACGVPIVGSYHGGQSSFLRESDSYLIRPDYLIEADESMGSWSEIYEDTLFADFSDDAIDEAAVKMRWVYENKQQAKKTAMVCRNRIVSDYSWDASAKLVYNRLLELQD
jgi:glycosyltransferase involved in cell wall biosynthesis